MKIAVQEYQTSNSYHGSRVPAKARLAASGSFIGEDGLLVVGGDIKKGDWYLEEDASIDGDGIVTIDAFEEVETTNNDSVDTGVTYSLALFDANGKHIETLLEGLTVYDILSTTSWDAIAEASNLPKRNYSVEVASRSWVQGLFNTIISGMQKATSVVIGAVKLTDTPDDLTQPTAVSASSPVYQSAIQSRYLRSFDNFEDAVDSLADTDAELIIDEPTVASFAEHTATPASLRIVFRGTGDLEVQGSKNLTINNLENPGNRKVFTGDNIRVSRKAVSELNLAWWGGTDETADMTAAFSNAFDNITANGGGTLILPGGEVLISEALDLPSGIRFVGRGVNAFNIAGTRIKLTTEADYMFRAFEDFRNIECENVSFDANELGETCFKAQGSYNHPSPPTTGTGLRFKNCQFHSATAALFDLNTTTVGAYEWECQQIKFDDCFWHATVEDSCAFRCNTANNGIVITNPQWNLAKGCDFFHLTKIGGLTVIGNIGGGTQYHDCSGGLPSTEMPRAFLWIGGTKGNILIQGIQDENLQYFLLNEGSDLSQPITFVGNRIQSKMHLEESCTIASVGNEYLSNAYTDGENSSSVVYSWGDHVRTQDVNCPNTVTVNPPNLNAFTHGSQIITHLSGGVVQIAIEANTNNLNPGNQFETIEAITDASRNLTGLAASVVAVKGERRKIVNGGGFNLVLKHQDTNSTATNRFICSTGADITLAPNQAADLERNYDNDRWRVFKRN